MSTTGYPDRTRAKVPLSPNGRIVIPAPIRQELGFAPGDTLLLEIEDGVLRIESFSTRLRRIQDELAQYGKPGILASDELIAERREEARREEEEMARDREMAADWMRKAGPVG